MQPFAPLHPPAVGIYSCGPTVYAPQHLGNMRSQLFPDLLRRVLLAAGYDVTYVTNITDVGHLVSDADEGDDKMEAAAATTGQTAAEIAAFYTEQWADDRRRLGCLEPDLVPRAAAHIDEQIAMVRTLEEQGHTYVIDDGVYFDVSTFPRYAEFAGLDLDELATSGRVEHVEAKRHPADFALWKLTPPGRAAPAGVGLAVGARLPRLAHRVLGHGHQVPRRPHFDIHTGGVDHIRVHHTNEVAQSECVLGVHPWVQIWMHNEFLDLGGEKISKSKGHVLVVDTLVERGFDPLAFRYFFLQAHYRQQQAFTWEAIEAAANAHRRLVGHAVEAREAGGEPDPTRVGAAPAAVLVGAGRRPQRARGRWRRCGTPSATRSSRRPTCGRSSPTPTGPSASAWPTVGGAGRRRERLRSAHRRAGRRAGGGAGRQGLRHVRSHPRRAGRRGHRAGRHARRPHLAPGLSARAPAVGSAGILEPSASVAAR